MQITVFDFIFVGNGAVRNQCAGHGRRAVQQRNLRGGQLAVIAVKQTNKLLIPAAVILRVIVVVIEQVTLRGVGFNDCIPHALLQRGTAGTAGAVCCKRLNNFTDWAAAVVVAVHPDDLILCARKSRVALRRITGCVLPSASRS